MIYCVNIYWDFVLTMIALLLGFYNLYKLKIIGNL